MTAPAKSLTKRANVGRSERSQGLTYPIVTARVFLTALVRLGYDRQALLNAAGVDFSRSDDPDAIVPCQAVGNMFGSAMRTRPLKNMGMRLAMETPMGAFPLLDYLVLTCETVGDAIRQLARYFRLNDAPYELEIQDAEDPVQIVFRSQIGSMVFEFGISLVVLHLREETENRLQPTYVSFVHRPDDIREIEEALGCPVRGEALWNGLALSPEAWRLPMRRRDSVLRSVLESHAKEILARLPEADDSVREIRRSLMARISQGDTEIESVARALATSSRSLQRRLAAAGTSFQEVLDATRRDVAGRYLEDRTLSVGEVAYLLGYSEPAAFHRAFKRWNGITPLEFRRQKA